MRKLAATIAAGFLLAASAGPTLANGFFAVHPQAGWVTYWVDLYYQPLTSGPNLPVQIVRHEMRAASVQAVEEVCAHNLLNMSRYLMQRTIFFHREMYAGGGKCVTDKSGAIKMVVGPASETAE